MLASTRANEEASKKAQRRSAQETNKNPKSTNEGNSKTDK
jgi:hypothetical protein